MNSNLEQLRVLYVEDDNLVRDSVGRTIARRVGEIFIAGNGQEGLEIFEKQDPDLVITDMEMPVMSGMEMIRQIRLKLKKDTPVIVITAYKDREHFTDMANGYIYKPVNKNDLFSMMEKLSAEVQEAG